MYYALIDVPSMIQSENNFGKHFLRSSSSTHLLKQGLLEQVAQDHVQAFEYFQRQRFHTLFGQPVLVLDCCYNKKIP